MPHFDLPLEQLLRLHPPLTAAPDFDDFWAATLAEARTHDLAAAFTAYDAALTEIEVYDVRYAGWGGHPIAGWLLLPRHRTAPAPAVVSYLGYAHGRGLPHDWLTFAAAGWASFVMDTRGQGWSGLPGDTPDPHGSGPHAPGFLTMGILDPAEHYYRRLYTDGVRAVEAVQAHPDVDSSRIVVHGRSQGGAVALAVAGLRDDLAGALVDVPFLTGFRRAIELVETEPVAEITRYLASNRGREEQVFRTLSYIEGLNFAARASAPALFSVGLTDDTCPPSTTIAAYNHYSGPKELRVYSYNGHEGGGTIHVQTKLRWLHALLAQGRGIP